MENLKQYFIERLLSTRREGMENVVSNLERLRFFTAPASTKFHLSIPGGLMLHSWNVCNTALMLRDQMVLMKPELQEKLPVESVIIASLLHDVCKSDIFDILSRLKPGRISGTNVPCEGEPSSYRYSRMRQCPASVYCWRR